MSDSVISHRSQIHHFITHPRFSFPDIKQRRIYSKERIYSGFFREINFILILWQFTYLKLENSDFDREVSQFMTHISARLW